MRKFVGPFALFLGEEVFDEKNESLVFEPKNEGRCVLVEWIELNDRRSLMVDKKLARELATALLEIAATGKDPK